MSKILVLGDIHGRSVWKEIIKKEQPDETIFLGDFVTTHEGYTGEQQLNELIDILDYVEADPAHRTICRGNHDTQALGYYWARCFPYVPAIVDEWFSLPANKERFLKNSCWVKEFVVGNQKVLASHAGISKVWLSKILKMNQEDFSTDTINAMEPSEKFGFNGDRQDNYGTSPQQSCTWIRPDTLQEVAIEGYDQIVGHTGTYGDCKKIPIWRKDENNKDDLSGNHIWMCDALAQGSYLIIEDGEIKIKNIKDGNE